MILIEDEPRLDDDLERAKAQVLMVLQSVQPVRTYGSLTDLAGFLDQVLDGMKHAGFPVGLTRVVLCHRNPAARLVVERRMVPGGRLVALDIPDAWGPMARDLIDLRAWAAHLSGLGDQARLTKGH
jgi:hypothetical protein